MRVTSDYVKERRLQAQLLTVEAQKKLEQAKNILATSLETYYSCFSIWEEYKQYSSFPEKPPKPLPSVTMPPRPLEQIVQSGTSVLAWFEKDRVKEAAAVHENAVRLWEQEC